MENGWQHNRLPLLAAWGMLLSGIVPAAVAPANHCRTLDSQGQATRAQVATMLMRFCENYA